MNMVAMQTVTSRLSGSRRDLMECNLHPSLRRCAIIARHPPNGDVKCNNAIQASPEIARAEDEAAGCGTLLPEKRQMSRGLASRVTC
jgi:hypothetical protein